jgi:hypothetical protein
MKGGLSAGFVALGIVVAAPWAHAQQAAAPASSATFNDAAPAAPVAPTATPPDAAAPPAASPTDTPAAGGMADTPPSAAPAPAPAPAPVAAPQPVAQPYVAPAVDDDEEAPSSGLGPMIAGWAVTAWGVANLVTYPICSADWYPDQSRDLCKVLSIGFGVAGVGVGVPLLIVGYSKRSKYNEWKKTHALQHHLLSTQVALQNNSAVVLYRGTF